MLWTCSSGEMRWTLGRLMLNSRGTRTLLNELLLFHFRNKRKKISGVRVQCDSALQGNEPVLRCAARMVRLL